MLAAVIAVTLQTVVPFSTQPQRCGSANRFWSPHFSKGGEFPSTPPLRDELQQLIDFTAETRTYSLTRLSFAENEERLRLFSSIVSDVVQQKKRIDSDLLTTATIHLIRSATQLNSYKTTLRIIEIIDTISPSSGVDIQIPVRIFTEACESLEKSGAAPSKIWRTWKKGCERCCAEGLGAAEGAVMIGVAGRGGKSRKAMEIFESITVKDVGSYSAIFDTLKRSICISSTNENENAWQWNETLRVLDTLPLQENLNSSAVNFVLTQSLSVLRDIGRVHSDKSESNSIDVPQSALSLVSRFSAPVYPDTIFLTSLLAVLKDFSNDINLALNLLGRMEGGGGGDGDGEGDGGEEGWGRANEYSFVTVLSMLARNEATEKIPPLLRSLPPLSDKGREIVWNVGVRSVLKSQSGGVVEGARLWRTMRTVSERHAEN